LVPTFKSFFNNKKSVKNQKPERKTDEQEAQVLRIIKKGELRQDFKKNTHTTDQEIRKV
jgi:hypothetical protein